MLVVGAGSIGTEVTTLLRRHGAKVTEARRSAVGPGTVQLDICSMDSIKGLDAALPEGVDHVVVCCGASSFGPIDNLDSAKWTENCMNKLVAVSRLVIMLANGAEVKCLRAGGSITVTAGQSARTVNKMWPGLAANNAGLEAFVRCAGLGAPRGVRINAVAPALVRETAEKAGLPLAGTVAAADCAACYLPLVFGSASGEVVDAGSQQIFTSSHTATASATVPTVETSTSAAPAEPEEGSGRISGTDFLDQRSSFVRSPGEGIVGLLAYDVCDALTTEEYDRWLFDVHYHDLMANPCLDKIILHTVNADKKAVLSSGATVENQFEFYRLAELHFKDYAAYDSYIAWFQQHIVPPSRTPAGKSAFKFYLLAESESILRP